MARRSVKRSVRGSARKTLLIRRAAQGYLENINWRQAFSYNLQGYMRYYQPVFDMITKRSYFGLPEISISEYPGKLTLLDHGLSYYGLNNESFYLFTPHSLAEYRYEFRPRNSNRSVSSNIFGFPNGQRLKMSQVIDVLKREIISGNLTKYRITIGGHIYDVRLTLTTLQCLGEWSMIETRTHMFTRSRRGIIRDSNRMKISESTMINVLIKSIGSKIQVVYRPHVLDPPIDYDSTPVFMYAFH